MIPLGKCYPKMGPQPSKTMIWRIKHVDDKNDTTAFLSKHNKTGGILKHDKFLTEEQTKQLYKGIDPTKGVSIKVTEPSKVENTYQKGIVSDIDQKINPKQMEVWSVLRDHVKYVQHDESDTLHNLNFDLLNYHLNEDINKELKEKEMLKTSIDFEQYFRKIEIRLFGCV